MKYLHADVFSNKSLKGNGLTIIFTDIECTDELQEIAKEFKQFETVFIYDKIEDYYPIRIFTVEEELDFAGHPIIGAAAAILKEDENKTSRIKFRIQDRIIETEANNNKNYFSVIMNQGIPKYYETLGKENIIELIKALNLTQDDISTDLPFEVVSTGLDYLIIPVKDDVSLLKSKIITNNFENLLSKVNAKFVYVFNPQNIECRTWDNLGNVEDVATGSAAGPLCAYLIKHGRLNNGKKIKINQGKYVGRPSVITAWMEKESSEIKIEGDVTFLVEGELII